MKKLLEVKREIGTLSKNAKNPFFKSKYLELSDLLTAVEPVLQQHELILLQPIIDNKVKSIIYDIDGNIICASELELPNIQDPQKLGSAITYFRRYTLKSLLGIAEVDDDGNKASKPTPKAKPKATQDTLDKAHKKGASIIELEKYYSLTPQQKKDYQDGQK